MRRKRRGFPGAGYLQNRIDTAGSRFLARDLALTGAGDSYQLFFSGWFRRDLLNDQGELLVAQPIGEPRFTINYQITNHFRVRYGLAPHYLQIYTFIPEIKVTDLDWHFFKVEIDLQADTGYITLDGLTGFYPPSFYMFGSGIGSFDWSALSIWRIFTDEVPSDWFDGACGDLVFHNALLTDPALAWNEGVPRDISSVSALIKLSRQRAADYEAGLANSYGTGGLFVPSGSGAFTDV